MGKTTERKSAGSRLRPVKSAARDEPIEVFLHGIKEEDERRTGKGVDWERRKNSWLKALVQFYGEVEKWLAPSIQSGAVQPLSSSVDLSEDYVGSYTAPALILAVGNHRVILQPVGTVIFGADGRVDLICGRHQLPLVWLEKSWWIVDRGQMARHPLTRESFEDVLRQVLRG